MSVCVFSTAIEAEAAGSLEVTDAAICEDVVDRAPVGANTSFSAAVGKLYGSGPQVKDNFFLN